jgi:hypothetical protein
MGNAFPVKPVIKRPTIKVVYKRLYQWQKDYGRTGPDKRAIDECMDTESAEYIRLLRTEFQAIAKGNYDDRLFQRTLGIARKQQHKSYKAWAKVMLQFMAAHKG